MKKSLKKKNLVSSREQNDFSLPNFVTNHVYFRCWIWPMNR